MVKKCLDTDFDHILGIFMQKFHLFKLKTLIAFDGKQCMAKVNTGKCCSRALLSEWENDLRAENFVTGSKKLIFNFYPCKKLPVFEESGLPRRIQKLLGQFWYQSKAPTRSFTTTPKPFLGLLWLLSQAMRKKC